MADKKEVVIKLTEEQRKQIKSTTGKDMTELKVGTVEDRANPFVEGDLLENRANPLKAFDVEERANPLKAFDVEDRANPMAAFEVE